MHDIDEYVQAQLILAVCGGAPPLSLSLSLSLWPRSEIHLTTTLLANSFLVERIGTEYYNACSSGRRNVCGKDLPGQRCFAHV